MLNEFHGSTVGDRLRDQLERLSEVILPLHPPDYSTNTLMLFRYLAFCRGMPYFVSWHWQLVPDAEDKEG